MNQQADQNIAVLYLRVSHSEEGTVGITALIKLGDRASTPALANCCTFYRTLLRSLTTVLFYYIQWMQHVHNEATGMVVHLGPPLYKIYGSHGLFVPLVPMPMKGYI